jgi:gentisate 1,2-dioxygenase
MTMKQTLPLLERYETPFVELDTQLADPKSPLMTQLWDEAEQALEAKRRAEAARREAEAEQLRARFDLD